KLLAVDPSGQVLTALLRRVEERVAPDARAKQTDRSAPKRELADDDHPSRAADPIIEAIERALANFENGRGKTRKGSSEALPAIQREIAWIEDRLKSGEVGRAEQALVTLIDSQGQRS